MASSSSSRERKGWAIFLFLTIVILSYVVWVHTVVSASSEVSNENAVSISGLHVSGIRAINESGVIFYIQFQVNNPTPLSVKLVNASYYLYGNGIFLGKGEIGQAIDIPAGSKAVVGTNQMVSTGGSLRLGLSYVAQLGNIAWRVKGNATLNVPFLGITIAQFNCVSGSSSSNGDSTSCVL